MDAHVSKSAFSALFALAMCVFPHAAFGEVKCAQLERVTIDAAHTGDIERACAGAREATAFLQGQGLDLPEQIRIMIVPRMPDAIPASAIAAFSNSSKRIFVLDYDAFLSHTNNLFGIDKDADLYQSIVGHEVAHAVALHNFRVSPSVIAQEYIGFVTLMSIMPPSFRARLLAQYPYDESWPSYAVILYMDDPLNFGIHAYRHFQLQENSREFLERVLNGDELGLATH